MSVWSAIVVYTTVHALGLYLLRASGTWDVIFAPRRPDNGSPVADPLRSSPTGWIENHEFWDLDDEAGERPARSLGEAFWGDVDGERSAG
jgi:hypothetical protein